MLDLEHQVSLWIINNKTNKNLIVEPKNISFTTNLDENIVVQSSYSAAGNPLSANIPLKDTKIENGKIEIKSGEPVRIDSGFYLNIKGYSKNRNYFLGKEVRFDIPMTIDGQEKIYKFAFRYDNYQ